MKPWAWLCLSWQVLSLELNNSGEYVKDLLGKEHAAIIKAVESVDVNAPHAKEGEAYQSQRARQARELAELERENERAKSGFVTK